MRAARSALWTVFLAGAALGAASGGVTASEVPVIRRSPRAEAVLAPAGVPLARIDHGRPAVKGRVIFGGLVPWGAIWRLGDDEATRLVAEVPLRLGGVALEAGEYALFAEPSPERWRLVINRVARQWGAYGYDKRFDAGRAELTVQTTEKPIENFSILWEPTEEGEGRLWFGWEKTVLSVAVSWPPSPPAPAAAMPPMPPMPSAPAPRQASGPPAVPPRR